MSKPDEGTPMQVGGLRPHCDLDTVMASLRHMGWVGTFSSVLSACQALRNGSY